MPPRPRHRDARGERYIGQLLLPQRAIRSGGELSEPITLQQIGAGCATERQADDRPVSAMPQLDTLRGGPFCCSSLCHQLAHVVYRHPLSISSSCGRMPDRNRSEGRCKESIRCRSISKLLHASPSTSAVPCHDHGRFDTRNANEPTSPTLQPQPGVPRCQHGLGLRSGGRCRSGFGRHLDRKRRTNMWLPVQR